MSTFIEARVIQKVDTEANWMANPLKLYQGEVAFVSDKYNFKLNTTEIPKTFAELEYYYKGDIIGSVLPTDDLAIKPDGVYRAATSGNYGGIVVKEGYYTLLRKKDGVWSLGSEVKMPMQDLTLINNSIQSLEDSSGRLETVLKSFLDESEVGWRELSIKQSHYQDNSYVNQSFGVTTDSAYESGVIDLNYLKANGISKLKITGSFDNSNVIWLMGTNNTTSVYDKKVSGVLSNSEYIINVEDIYEWYSISVKKSNTKIFGLKSAEDAVKKFVESKTTPLETVLKSFLQPADIDWIEVTFPTPGDAELENKFCNTNDFGIYDSIDHNIGYLRNSFLKDYDYIKMDGGMDTTGAVGNWLWLQDLTPSQKFESVLRGIYTTSQIVEINHNWQGYGYTRHKTLTKIWVGKKLSNSLEDDAVLKAINLENKTAKEKILNGDKPQLIKGFNGLSGEANVLKFKGKTLLYCTEGWQTEIITVHDYNIKTNTVSNRSIVANSANTGISAETFKASCFFVLNQKVYMVCTTWNINSCFMMESVDGRTFTMVSTTLADVSGFKPYLYGNHLICPEKINGYYYWFIEGTNSAGIWQMKLMKSQSITTGWELVGNIEGLNPSGGAKGGPCVYYDNGKFKMIYHYSPVASNLPTYLALAESNIEDPLYFTPLIMPLLDVTYKPYPVTDQVADPELFEIDGKMYLICTIVDNTNGIAHLHRWDGYGRLFNALGSRIE